MTAVLEHADVHALVLDLEASGQMDTTSADMLGRLLDALREKEIDLYLVRVFAVPRAVLDRSGLVERLGPDHVWHSIAAGVKAARHAPALAWVIDQEGPDQAAELDEGTEGEEHIAATVQRSA
jgi:MFS superfamily sulfate permease-like transporter